MNFEEAKQCLRAEPGNGQSTLYDHLSTVLLQMIIEKKDGMDFEEISAAVRRMAFPKPANAPQEETEEGMVPESKAAQLEWVQSQYPLFTPPTEDSPEEATVSDIMHQANLWEWAGISLGRDTTYRLYLSLKALAASKGVALRFWGKLYSRNGDYYVAESLTAENPAEGEARFEMEGSEGPNKYTYWVSKAPSNANSWRQLPHVTPKQLVVVRQIRRYLTGDLDATVPCFPPLPGNKEENLVRATIALITADAVLALNGTLVLDEEAEEDMAAVKPADEEELQGLSFSLEDLKDMSTWVHAELDINSVGRTQKTPLPLNEDGEPIEPEEEDPSPQAPLRSIAEDMEADRPLWSLRTCPASAGQQAPNSIVFAKSLRWPGAVCVASGKTTTNIYVGFGVSNSPTPKKYSFRMPSGTLAEWKPPGEGEEGLVLIEQEDVTVEPAPPEEEEE